MAIIPSVDPDIANRLAKVSQAVPGDALQSNGLHGGKIHASVEVARVRMGIRVFARKYSDRLVPRMKRFRSIFASAFSRTYLDAPTEIKI